MVNVFLGSDVTRVRGVRGTNRETVQLEFASGQTATIENISALGRASYHVLLFGQRGDSYTEVVDIGRPLLKICEAFVDMGKGGPVPIPPSEGLHLNAIVFAAEEAVRRGEEMQLPR
jgi:hypothetical protein